MKDSLFIFQNIAPVEYYWKLPDTDQVFVKQHLRRYQNKPIVTGAPFY